MYLAKVIGTVVSTSKDERLVGFKLLLTQRLVNDALVGNPDIAVDTVGAGPGEVVIVAKGSSARMACGKPDAPIDATIVGIVDTIEIVK